MGYLTLLKYQIGASIRKNKTLNRLVYGDKGDVSALLWVGLALIIVTILVSVIGKDADSGIFKKIKDVLGLAPDVEG